MLESLGPILYVVALVAVSAGILWLVEGIAKLIGGRTWLIFVGAVPLVLSLMYCYYSWGQLSWWQRILFPLSGPVLAGAVLMLGFAAVNPAGACLLVAGSIGYLWRRLSRNQRTGRKGA